MNSALLIRYTPEDTVRSNFDNVIDASVAAVQAGADIISVADTTGFMIPTFILMLLRVSGYVGMEQICVVLLKVTR